MNQEGILILIDLAGKTIAQLQAELEHERQISESLRQALMQRNEPTGEEVRRMLKLDREREIAETVKEAE